MCIICYCVLPGKPFQPSLMFVGKAKKSGAYSQTLDWTGKVWQRQTLELIMSIHKLQL
jgi:hypothetical protein